MAGRSEESPIVLVTGLAGFTGRHLAKFLETSGWRVIGFDRLASNSGEVETRACSLLDKDAVAREIEAIAPSAVIHLAGISSVIHENVNEIYETNIIGTRNLLEALAKSRTKIRSLVLASSANIYGNKGGYPIDETTAPDPSNDYAISKLAMEFLAKTYVDKLPITIMRPFNYTGRGQSERFVIPKIVEHFKRRAPSIELGNIDVVREFSDVRRVVSAYARLLSLPGKGDIYNICSGVGMSLRQIISLAEGLTGHHPEIRQNQAFIRSNEVDVLIGSCAKIEAALGPLPYYSIRETLAWMLEV